MAPSHYYSSNKHIKDADREEEAERLNRRRRASAVGLYRQSLLEQAARIERERGQLRRRNRTLLQHDLLRRQAERRGKGEELQAARRHAPRLVSAVADGHLNMRLMSTHAALEQQQLATDVERRMRASAKLARQGKRRRMKSARDAETTASRMQTYAATSSATPMTLPLAPSPPASRRMAPSRANGSVTANRRCARPLRTPTAAVWSGYTTADATIAPTTGGGGGRGGGVASRTRHATATRRLAQDRSTATTANPASRATVAPRPRRPTSPVSKYFAGTRQGKDAAQSMGGAKARSSRRRSQVAEVQEADAKKTNAVRRGRNGRSGGRVKRL